MKEYLKILSLAMQVSRETDHDVSVEYYGHTNSMRVYIYMGGFPNNLTSLRSPEVNTGEIQSRLMDLLITDEIIDKS